MKWSLASVYLSDYTYKKHLNNYNGTDSVLALFFWIIIIVSYYLSGLMYAKFNFYSGGLLNIFFLLVCFMIVALKKDSFKSIGFNTKNTLKPSIIGIALGLTFVLFNGIIPGVFNARPLSTPGYLFNKFFYYMFIISLPEEIIFRAYIQTRLYGLIKNGVLVVVIGAFLFMLFHIPFQLAINGIEGLNLFVLIMTAFWHIIFNSMYRKYYSIYGVIIFHGLMDWSNYLYIH